MKKFEELCEAYNKYLDNTAIYHTECSRLLDKLRYTFLADLECNQSDLLFMFLEDKKKEKPVDSKGNGEQKDPVKKDIECGPQAHPLMRFGEDGFWHIGLMIQLPKGHDPEKKGKIWFQILIKKPSLKAKHFVLKINLRPPLEQKIPTTKNEEALVELCDSIFMEAKHFYEEGFQKLLARDTSTKTIGFQATEEETI